MVNKTASRGGSISWWVSSRAGYKLFFRHVDRLMRMMADLLRRSRFADEIMAWYAQEDRRLAEACTRLGRNDPCPCGAKDADGNSIKFKKCHGK